MTYVQLRDLNVAALEIAAVGWRRQAVRLTACEDDVVHAVTRPLRDARWSGTAARQALLKIEWLDDHIQLAASAAQLIARALDAAAARWRALQDRLHQLAEDATRHGLVLNEAGISLPPANPAYRHFEEYAAQRQQLATAAGLLRQRVQELLQAAADLDREVAAVIDKLQPFSAGSSGDVLHELREMVSDARAVAALAGYRQSDLPELGVDPKQAAAWWGSVAADDRALLLQAFPEHLGALDGLPATDRNTANRAHLDYCLGGGLSGNANYDATMRLRNLLEDAEFQRPEPLLLLGFDAERDGQAVVAIGNPDTAAHTAVVVPGINTDLGDMPGQIARASDIRSAADLMTPGASDVSVIAWLGYDTPVTDQTAVGWERASQGGQSLDSFVNGLNVAHDQTPSHVTAIGHSYGSAVVGEAARNGDGLAVGDIVVAGSPGMHVNTAAELHIDPRHVWAGAAGDDPISGWAGSIPGVHENEPSDPSFGANRYRVDTSGHSGYWHPGSVSLNNQAAVIVGDYAMVTLDHGSVPR